MITIFTPIYNRAYIVENLYHSLLRQTCHDFEWLIMDDGSTDDIAAVVNQWAEQTHEFEIRLFRQGNKGKHCAVNCGVRLAKYEIFFIVDSDDYLEDDAVETILRCWDGIKGDNQFAGIAGLRKNRKGEIIGGTPRFKAFTDATNLERERFGLEGDKAEVLKTDLLRKHPFPEYENEKFITEAVVWDRLAYEGYKIRWINKSFVICEYLQDGLTVQGERLFFENPRGWAEFLRVETKYRAKKRGAYLKDYYYYYEYAHKKLEDNEIKEMLDLDDMDFGLIKRMYIRYTHNLSELCRDKKVCIYAYGRWGRRLKRYLDDLKIQVAYVIDQKYQEIKEVKAFSIEMNLPETELVFVALKNGADEAAEAVRRKMPEAEVVLCRDMVPDLWQEESLIPEV